MPRASIADIRANSEFQKTFEWYFSFIRWPKAVATSITQDRFNMQCLSTSKPHKSSKAEVFMMRGEQIFDIGIYKVTGMLPLVFLETVDGIIHEMFMDWENALSKRAGSFTDLTADLRLAEMDNQDNDNWEYQIKWCFPENFKLAHEDAGEQGAPPMQMGFDLCYSDYTQQKITG
jgi:hypothetical protein